MAGRELPILVIDDEDLVRQSIERDLSRVGYDVRAVGDAEAGLEALEKERFGCVITDLRMPGMGGHGFVRRCRKIDPELPVIVISAHAEKDDVIECLRAGVFEYLDKPWPDGSLRLTVGRALESRAAPATMGGPPADQTAPPALPSVRPTPPPAMSAQGKATRRTSLGTIIERIRQGQLMLPAIPAVAIELRRVVSAPGCSVTEVRRLVEQDSHLCAKILRIANGPLHAAAGRTSDLKIAIVRVGFREVSQIVDALVARDFYKVDHPGLQDALWRIWRHSWTRGVVMRLLAQETAIEVAPEAAFLAGLFSDAGAPTLYRVLAQATPDADSRQIEAFVAEHHALIGATVATAWNLPAECADAARRHHEPVSASAPPVVQLVWAAEPICEQLGQSGDPAAVIGGPDAIASLVPDLGRQGALRDKAEEYLQGHSSVLG